MTVPSLTPDELLSTTRSVRKRLDLTRPVPIPLVRECLEVALQAPTGGDRQGWHWLVVTDPDLRATIAGYYRRSYEAAYGGSAEHGGSAERPVAPSVDPAARAAPRHRGTARAAGNSSPSSTWTASGSGPARPCPAASAAGWTS